MKRRGFIFGMLAAPAIVRASSLMPIMPMRLLRLWGDGVRDDSAAMMALMHGNDVWMPDGVTVWSTRAYGGAIHLPPGRFAIGQTISIKVLRGATLIGSSGPEKTTLVRMTNFAGQIFRLSAWCDA